MVNEDCFINWLKTNYYDKKTQEHVERVAEYIHNNPLIPAGKKDYYENVAILHDIIEDNKDKIPTSIFSKEYSLALFYLTKLDNVSYDEYCDKLNLTHYFAADGSSTLNCIQEEALKCAWWVKLADMKDHLMLTDTLTDKLKEKYLSGLRYLL